MLSVMLTFTRAACETITEKLSQPKVKPKLFGSNSWESSHISNLKISFSFSRWCAGNALALPPSI